MHIRLHAVDGRARDPGGSPFPCESGCACPRERRAVGARPKRYDVLAVIELATAPRRAPRPGIRVAEASGARLSGSVWTQSRCLVLRGDTPRADVARHARASAFSGANEVVVTTIVPGAAGDDDPAHAGLAAISDRTPRRLSGEVPVLGIHQAQRVGCIAPEVLRDQSPGIGLVAADLRGAKQHR